MKSFKLFICTILIYYLTPNILLAKTSFAILPIEYKKDIKQSQVTTASARFSSDLLKTKKYKLVDRQKIKDVLKEQQLQQTGISDQAKLIKAGKILGVDKMISSTLSKKPNTVCMQINVINTETGEIELTVQKCDTDAAKAASLCARKVVLKYPVEGKIKGIVGNNIVINLGQNDGITTNHEIFVARRSLLKDKRGNVLFADFFRIGKLEVVKVSQSRTLCKVLSLAKKGEFPKINDIVSHEPIPYKGAQVSHKPFFPKVRKGKKILFDNMSSRKYLSPANNESENYISGKLSLNNKSGKNVHSYCYYPAPFDKLADYILEVDIKFEKIAKTYNKISVSIRDDRDYHYGNAYSFFINNKGNYEISMYKSGDLVNITTLETSPHIKRETGENTVKIVAKGAKFDFYINDKYIISFFDETFRRGGIGFYAGKYSHILIDDLKIWEIKK